MRTKMMSGGGNQIDIKKSRDPDPGFFLADKIKKFDLINALT